MILSGILLTPTGLPYKNSSVRITANNTSEQVLMFVTKDFKTDEDGSYEIDVPNGWYHVSVFSLEYRSYANIGNIEITDDTTQTTINELLMLDQTAHSDGLAAQVAADAASALASKNAAAVSASQAATSATNSASSATASQTSATNSQASAVSSASSAVTATTKATESAASASASLNSANDAEASAVYTEGLLSTKVNISDLANNADLAKGASLVGYKPPVGPGIYISQYSDRNKLFAGDASEIQQAIDYASSQGGRDVTLLPNVIYDMGLSSITMKAGVELRSDTGHAVSVQHLVTSNPKGLPVLKCGALSGDFVIVPSTAFNNVIRNIIIDARLQVTGDALKYSDAAGVQRTDSKAENILVYKHGSGSAIRIQPNHKEGGFREVFARCGSGVPLPTDGQYGLYCESIDWDFNRLLCGFALSRSFIFTGGACRFRDVDAWGSQDISAEIQGSSVTIDRLQVDGSGNSGVLINGGDDVVISKLISINNCLTAATPTDDLIIRGECRGLSLSQVRMRGTSGNDRYAIAVEDTAVVAGSVEGFNFASSYLDGLNDKARAYLHVSGATNALSPARTVAPTPVVVNSNPLFTKYSAGIPLGWTLRGSATTAQATPTGITTGKYNSAVSITSGNVGVSGIQIILDVDEFKDRRIRCEGWFKGSGSTFLGNQRIQLFDGVNTFVENIPNDGQYHWLAIDSQMAITATNVQIRLVAANDTTAGLVLECTAVTVTAY